MAGLAKSVAVLMLGVGVGLWPGPAVAGMDVKQAWIGADVGCIEAGACVIVVETTPKTSVYLSRKAALDANIEFDTSFRMLFTER